MILRTGSVVALAVTVSGRHLAKAGESRKQTTCDLLPKVINRLSVNTILLLTDMHLVDELETTV